MEVILQWSPPQLRHYTEKSFRWLIVTHWPPDLGAGSSSTFGSRRRPGGNSELSGILGSRFDIRRVRQYSILLSRGQERLRLTVGCSSGPGKYSSATGQYIMSHRTSLAWSPKRPCYDLVQR